MEVYGFQQWENCASNKREISDGDKVKKMKKASASNKEGRSEVCWIVIHKLCYTLSHMLCYVDVIVLKLYVYFSSLVVIGLKSLKYSVIGKK